MAADEDIVEISDDDQNDDCATLDAKLKKVRCMVSQPLVYCPNFILMRFISSVKNID